MRFTWLRVTAAMAGGLLGLAAVQSVSAHDVHDFGPYTIALGWLHEPADVGVDNAVQVLVRDQQGPVTDLTDQSLTVEVTLGQQKLGPVPLVPTADPDTGLGTPGELEYHFIPTAPGNYTFHLHGSIHGVPVDETVTASDKTFNSVTSAADAEFPAKVPAASDLATRIDRETARLQAAQASVASAASAAASAKDAANRALLVGIIGIVVAVALGGTSLAVALLGRRGRRA